MLSKQQRIPRSLFGSLKQAKVLGNDIFFVKLAKYNGKQSRFCVSVSKKIAKSAVLRNRMRRLGYRILSNNLENVKESFLVHISWKKIAKELEVEKAILDIINKINKQ